MPRQLAPLWEALKEGCGSCRFGMAVPNSNSQEKKVICRRYPPGVLQDAWQPIDGWCGEWQREQVIIAEAADRQKDAA